MPLTPALCAPTNERLQLTGLSVVGVVIRTALENRTLSAELPGYAEYAARVGFRLVPGFW